MKASFSEVDLVRSVCSASFFEFVQEFWDVVIPDDPVWNWHIEYLCDELQDMAERVFANEPKEYDLIVNIPPGTTKSTIHSVMFAPWTWTRMPRARHLIATHTDQLGMDFSRKSRDIVESAKYQEAWPNIKLREDQNTKGYYVNTQGGYRLTATIGGKNPMGFHAHFLGVDDPIDPAKALSEAEIKQANDFVDQTLPSRKVNKKVSVTSIIMQRLHQNDPTGHLLDQAKHNKKMKIKHVCLPAEVGENVKPERLKRKYKNGLLDPTRLSEDVLEEFKLKGDYFYSGQFGQHPVPPGGGMFKIKNLEIGTPPDLSKFRRICRYWDNAGTKDGDGAYTAGCKVGQTLQGQWWILHCIRGRWESNEREQTKKRIANSDTKKVIIGQEQEPGSSGKDVGRATVRMLAGYRVKLDKPTGDKVWRADAVAAQINAGHFKMAEGEWNSDFLDEMMHFPNSTYKDQIDALSGAFNLLTRKVSVGAVG